MINPTLIVLYILIFLFIILYFNKEKLKSLFLKFKKSEKEKYVKICPRCGSINIGTDFSNPVVWAYGASPKYKCMKCGYMGALFPEVPESKIKYYKSRIEKGLKLEKITKEPIDASTGYYVGIWEVILALLSVPFFLIIAVFSFYNEGEKFDIFFNLVLLLWIVFFINVGLKIVKNRKNPKSF
ncbi:hypothetical protein HYX00_04380 [Candidatus Woesearchaeota archaeon]|nr:hypothetical protein [Candidatus Woesearchaeota archaeon]